MGSKSEKAAAARAPSTPKVPSRNPTQNKFKNDYHWPAEVEEILKLPIDEFFKKTGFNMRVLYLAHLNEKRLQADTSRISFFVFFFFVSPFFGPKKKKKKKKKK